VSRVAEVLDSTRVNDEGAHGLDVKCDPGGGDNVTAFHFADAGDDGRPLPGDFVALEDSSGSGAEQATGYADTKNAGKALPGEKRIYSRDAEGAIVAEVWLQGDGKIEMITPIGVRLGAANASEAIPKGTTQKQKLDQILAYLQALEGALTALPVVTEAGGGAASSLQAALKGATAGTPLPADLNDTISTKHKIDG
jgi:hypothetical protein